MKDALILTHYNGPIEIYQNVAKKFNLNLIIYNKRNCAYGLPVPNVGVDAYDKLHFIIKNYDSLPRAMLFSTDQVQIEAKKIKKFNFILKTLPRLHSQSGFLTGHIFKIPATACDFTLDKYKGKKLILSSIRPFDRWFQAKINTKINPQDIYISKKSIFAVSRDLVLKNSKSYYEELFEEVKQHSREGHDSEVPHYFEMAWVEIFCHNNKKHMIHDVESYGELV